MYVWQSKYRKERLNVVAETLQQQEEDEARDERLRCQLELDFIETTLQNIDTAIRKYLETSDGGEEVEVIMPMVPPGDTSTSNRKYTPTSLEYISESQLLVKVIELLSPMEVDLSERDCYHLIEQIETACRLRFNKDYFVAHFQKTLVITRDDIYACTILPSLCASISLNP